MSNSAAATEALPMFLVLSQRAQEVGLLVGCLRPHHGSGGAAFEVELYEPDGALWARLTWAYEPLVRRVIEKYAQKRGEQTRPLGGPAAVVRCARRGCRAAVTLRPGEPMRLIEGWTFADHNIGWLCPADSLPLGAEA